MSKPTSKQIIIAALIAVLVVGIGALSMTMQTPEAAIPAPVDTVETAMATESGSMSQPNPDVANNAKEAEETTIGEFDISTAEPWVIEAIKPRSIGSDKAPVTMYNFSSMTCPHCGTVHFETLPQIKKNYVETGKVKIVFDDYPLNLPALQATALTRCITDNDAYFATVEQLYKTQAEWGMTQNARNDLLNITKFSGLTREQAAKCIDSESLKAGIVAAMAENRKKYDLSSTPHFIITNGLKTERVSGARPYEEFEKAIEKVMN